MNDTLGWRQLYDLKLDALEECEAAWQRTVEVADECKEDAGGGVDRLNAALGEMHGNALYSPGRDAAISRSGAFRTRFADAATEATGISMALTDAVDRLRDVRSRFRDYVDTIESDTSASSDGGGHFSVEFDTEIVAPPSPPSAEVYNVPEVNEQWRNAYTESARFHEDELHSLVAEAREVDEDISGWLLNHSANQAEFNGDAKEAAEQIPSVREALDAADAAADVINDAVAGGLTDDETAEINELLAEYEDNPYFATHLMNQLGPEGLANLSGMALGSNDVGGPGQPDGADELLDRVAGMLSTATDSTNEPHLGEDWHEEFRELGVSNIIVGEGRDDSYDALGYEVLAPLLGRGDEFDSDFIVPVSEHLLALNASPGNDVLSTEYAPLEAALTGLSNSPDAALDFFTPGASHEEYPGVVGGVPVSAVDDPLDHFVNDHVDHNPEAGSKIDTQIIGNAVEAASTGLPPGSDWTETGRPETTPEMAEFTNRLIDTVEENPSRFTEEGGMNGMVNNFGNITAAYADDFYSAYYLASDGVDYSPDIVGTPLGLDSEPGDWMQVLGYSEYATATAGEGLEHSMAHTMLEASEFSDSDLELNEALNPYAKMTGEMSSGREDAIESGILQEDEGRQDAKDVATRITGAWAPPYLGPEVESLTSSVVDVLSGNSDEDIESIIEKLQDKEFEEKSAEFSGTVETKLDQVLQNLDPDNPERAKTLLMESFLETFEGKRDLAVAKCAYENSQAVFVSPQRRLRETTRK